MLSRNFVRVLAVCILVVLAVTAAQAAVKLPAVIGDDMVLQRGQPVPIWGWADKGEEVTVTVAGQEQKATAGEDGRWKVTLDKLAVGQPLTMTIEGSSGSKITLKNILVGEVWVCSGQSNMEMGVGGCNNAAKEIAAAKYPNIRLFTVEKVKAAQPANDVKGRWAPCSPQVVGNGGWGGFSATAYFFGRKLYKELKVPIGLIHTSWGGTPAEFWTSRKALEANPVAEAAGPGRSVLPLQRHDRPVDPVCHSRRNLVSGRGQRRRGLPLSHALSGDDRQLACRLGRGRFPLPLRAARPVQLSQRRRQPRMLSRIVGGATADAEIDAQHRHGSDHRHRRRPEQHPSDGQAGRGQAVGPLGIGQGLRPQARLFRPDLQVDGGRRRQDPPPVRPPAAAVW